MGEWLQGVFGSSAVLSGGLTLALLGLLVVWLREVPGKVFGWAKHFLITTLTVDSRDERMFPALVEYMDSRESLRRLNNFTARAVRQGTAYQSLHDELQQGGKPLTVLSPGEGF
jgi:chaperone BCS1